ncbi:MAG: TerB family tellurite resistance protein [Cytophagales bacterium]|nr:TerB family tellurite resistance protein [Cytophagales bacterium]
MTLTKNKTHFVGGLVALYHLLITADGQVDERELKMGEAMKKHEDIDDWEFDSHLNRISELGKERVIEDCVYSLKQCDYDMKVRCIAWMSLIANADGFMAPEEWKLIYNIYHTELELNLADILEIQKKLPWPE